MRTNLFINGKRATKKEVLALVGAYRLDIMISEAKNTYANDPNIQNDFYVLGGTMLTISFS